MTFLAVVSSSSLPPSPPYNVLCLVFSVNSAAKINFVRRHPLDAGPDLSLKSNVIQNGVLSDKTSHLPIFIYKVQHELSIPLFLVILTGNL